MYLKIIEHVCDDIYCINNIYIVLGMVICHETIAIFFEKIKNLIIKGTILRRWIYKQVKKSCKPKTKTSKKNQINSIKVKYPTPIHVSINIDSRSTNVGDGPLYMPDNKQTFSNSIIKPPRC